MPVSSCQPSYLTAVDRWRQIRDCIEGSQAIKHGGCRYLPMLGSQVDQPGSYEAYKKRALFVNAVNRTHDAILGFLFRKTPVIRLGPPESTIKLISSGELENVDLQGNSLIEYSRLVGDDVASVGRCGTLIDWVDVDGFGRPRFTFYAAESITNWRAKMIGGRMLITMLVLKETVQMEGGSDEFDEPYETQYRVLRLTDEGVTVSVYKGTRELRGVNAIPLYGGDVSPGPEFLVEELGVMKRRGRPLMEMPFVFHNADHIGPEIGISPLYDLSEINISHYQTSADLENGRHIAGVPTPYAFGLTSSGEPVKPDLLYLGGPAWLSDNSDATVGFLEFTGAGLGSLEKALQEKLSAMAAVGARIMEPKPADAEAFETVALRATSETSALAHMASHISRSMTDALRWFAWWTGTADTPSEIEDVRYEINRDFVAARLQPDELRMMLAMVDSGKMSFDTFFHNLQRADIYPEGRTMEEERASIQEQITIPIPAPQPPPAAPVEDEEEETPPARPARKVARKAATRA